MIGRMILFLALFTVTLASEGHEQINYDEQNHWGDICVTGEHQSPIDVPLPSSKVKVSAKTPFLKLPMQYFVMTNLNNANTVKYSVEPDQSVAQVPWMDNREVTLMQLHLHWGESAARGSEHLIGGKAFAAEAHLVTSYTDSDGSTKYMVFARVFKAGKANALVEQMIEGAKEEDEDRKIDFFDLSALYPASADIWKTYMGGLTTPPCSEVVHWVIVRKPLTISKRQLKKLRRMSLGNGDMPAMSRNWREVQPLNGRESTKYYRG